MRILRWLFLSFIVLIVCQANGQAKLGATIDSFPTNAVIGDTMAYSGSIFIHNYGSAFFGDTFALQYRINGVTYIANDPNVGIYLLSDTANLQPGDSVRKPIHIHFTSSVFLAAGSSGVVIWPISGSAATYDSSSYQFVLSGPAGLAQTTDERLHVYMDGSQLVVKLDEENLIKRVRIYDLNGKLMEERGLSSIATISLDKYASGIYFAEILFGDDSRNTFKIINMTGH